MPFINTSGAGVLIIDAEGPVLKAEPATAR